MATPTKQPQRQSNVTGAEADMQPRPSARDARHRGSGKLQGKVALVTGGDSGIGRGLAIAFAREGAHVAIVYKEQHQDARDTCCAVEQEGGRCICIPGDVGDDKFCTDAVERTVRELGGLNILVNNAATQEMRKTLEEISREQLELTFRTNIFSMFFMAQAALKHMNKDDCIINTASVTAYKGNPALLDYSATKGAIVTFTRSLALSLAERGIRVNAVAPGPIWTPLIPASFPPDKVEKFGQDVPLGRPGQPEEVASAYVFLASNDASYMTGQILHPNGGTIVNG